MAKPIHPFNGLSGLRALACLSVIYYHLNQLRSIDGLGKWDWNWYQFTETLTIAVSFFFILTGAGISIRFWTAIFENKPLPPVWKGYIERGIRVAPVYWIVLLVTFVLVLLTQGSTGETWVRFISGIFFLTWIHPTTFFPVDINGPLWYISFDIIGSLLVFGTMGILGKMKKQYIPLGLLGIVGLLILSHFIFIQIPFPVIPGIMSEWFPVHNPFLFGLHFVLGVVLGAGMTWGMRVIQNTSLWFDIGWVICVLILGRFLWYIRDMGDYVYSVFDGPFHFPIVGLLIAGIIGFIPFTRVLVNISEWKFFKFIAKISYSIYLWHTIVIVLLHRLIFSEQTLLMGDWLVLSVISIGITFPVAWASYILLEQGVSGRLKLWWERGE